VILKNATTDLIIGLRGLVSSYAFRTDVFDPCVTNILAIYEVIIAQEAEPNLLAKPSSAHLHMIRSSDLQEEDQDSRSPSVTSFTTTFSARDPKPDELLSSSLEYAQTLTEIQIQAVVYTIPIPLSPVAVPDSSGPQPTTLIAPPDLLPVVSVPTLPPAESTQPSLQADTRQEAPTPFVSAYLIHNAAASSTKGVLAKAVISLTRNPKAEERPFSFSRSLT
jgi:hypothetical protein